MPNPMTKDSGNHDAGSTLALEYTQVNENFRMLADIRFKLLALVPTLGGAAIFALTTIGDAPTVDDLTSAKVILTGVMGFLATLGITFYDQRNSELYTALVGRAKFLEDKLELHLDERALEKIEEPEKLGKVGGQFRERPKRGRRLLGLILLGHDTGLALIYGPVLGGWFFPIVFASLRLAGREQNYSVRVALYVTVAVILVAIEEMLRFDGTWKKLWKKLSGKNPDAAGEASPKKNEASPDASGETVGGASESKPGGGSRRVNGGG